MTDTWKQCRHFFLGPLPQLRNEEKSGSENSSMIFFLLETEQQTRREFTDISSKAGFTKKGNSSLWQAVKWKGCQILWVVRKYRRRHEQHVCEKDSFDPWWSLANAGFRNHSEKLQFLTYTLENEKHEWTFFFRTLYITQFNKEFKGKYKLRCVSNPSEVNKPVK